MRNRTAAQQRQRWCAAVIAAAALALSCRSERADALRVPPGLLVAHALGSIDGIAYTNSLEALRCNHARGFRWFEVDLTLTADRELVAFHTRHERQAKLPDTIDQLPYSEVQNARYRGKFAIPRFSDVLKEARTLGGVVLVLDTKSWQPQMLDAVRRELLASGEQPRVVFQSYGEKDIQSVAALAKEVGAGLILTLYQTRALDEVVLQMAKEHGAIAVVASQQRFTPWLAEQLHASQIPILVHTVNDHDQVVRLTRAGADGFYTDTYVPYEVMAKDRHSLLACGQTAPSLTDLKPWLGRDLKNVTDFQLSTCAKRIDNRIELRGCNAKPAITGPNMPVPRGSVVHVTLDVEAPAAGSQLWMQSIWKGGPKPGPRETIQLGANERRTVTRETRLEAGSSGVEVRVGMSSADSQATVHRLSVTREPPSAEGRGVPVASPRDGG